MLMVMAALAGILGVALSAAAAHSSAGPNLDTASRFLLLHAPVLLAIVALAAAGLVHVPTARAAGWIIVLGLVLFCGDLASRTYRGVGLFPMAAPSGGFALMAGWALLGLAALIRVFR
jgi:uncharacterized membrane protein YgdD (TMEM256/DUF423 family)